MRNPTLRQVRKAYWQTFHKSGELWFNYLGDEHENYASTRQQWMEFLYNLNKVMLEAQEKK